MGKVTRFVDGKENGTSPIHIRLRSDAYALDTEYGGNRVSVVSRGGNGARWSAGDGRPFSARNLQIWHFPFQLSLLDPTNTATQMEDLGQEMAQGMPTEKVRIWGDPDAVDPAKRLETVYGSHMTVWIATQTGLPAQIEYRKPNAFRLSFSKRLRVLSDYRTVGQVMLPFHEQEYDGNELLWDIQFKEVQINAPLTDADFPLANGGQQ